MNKEVILFFCIVPICWLGFHAHSADLEEAEAPRDQNAQVQFVIEEPSVMKSFDTQEAHQIIEENKGKIIIGFFDLDETLIRPKYLLRCLNKAERSQLIYKATSNAILDENDPNHQHAVNFTHWLNRNMDYYDYVTTEETVVDYMEILHEGGAYLIGLTARKMRFNEITTTRLNALGINFEQWSHLGENPNQFRQSEESDVGLDRGIYYTANTYRKMYFIPGIIRKTIAQLKLDKNKEVVAYFIDNKQSEIDAFQRYIITLRYADRHFRVKPRHYCPPQFVPGINDDEIDDLCEIEAEVLYNEFCELKGKSHLRWVISSAT